MLKAGGGSGSGVGGGWAQPCDSCHGAACAVYCRADSAYLCASCDGRIHGANQVSSRHERVWVCEACEQAPAVFTCKADAANLCTTCDADIHSANPLARRHHRVPIVPIHGCIFGHSAVTHLGRPSALEGNHEDLFSAVEKADEEAEKQDEDEDETESWLLLNPIKSNYQSNGFLFDGEVNEYLDFLEYNNSCSDTQYQVQHNQQQQNSFSFNLKRNEANDSVVPVNGELVKEQHEQQQQQMEYEASKAGFSYTTGSASHSVSMSSMDASIVPDSTMNDISNCHNISEEGKAEHHVYSNLHTTQMQPQFSPKDREARVLRYREKRKTRKFEKTIRYASRKAYAETRPRIKGRFAKRTDVEHDVDTIFVTTVMGETGYGIVPSF